MSHLGSWENGSIYCHDGNSGRSENKAREYDCGQGRGHVAQVIDRHASMTMVSLSAFTGITMTGSLKVPAA